MSTMTANVAKLVKLVQSAKDADAAKVSAVRKTYADALAAAAEKRKEAIEYLVTHLTEALATGSIETDNGTAYVKTSARGRRVTLEATLPEGVSANGQDDLPYNPDAEGESDKSVAARTGTKTPEFHDRTLAVLNVNEGPTIEIDTTQFTYYL